MASKGEMKVGGMFQIRVLKKGILSPTFIPPSEASEYRGEGVGL